MIWFYKFELRLQPGAKALTLYAPDWEQAQKSKVYQDFLRACHPRSLEVARCQYWYPSVQNRAATPEEIKSFTVNNAYLRNPLIQQSEPARTYQYFGDRSVLDPLTQKLCAEYEQYRAEWKTCMDQGREALYDRLEQVCAVQTVYQNILVCGNCYPTEYMAALLRLDRPLQCLSVAYVEQIGFQIEPEIVDLLASMEQSPEELAHSPCCEIDPAAVGLLSHAKRIEQLRQNLDREFQTANQIWEALDFEGVLKYAVGIFSTRQLYQGLKENLEHDSTEQLDRLAILKNPLTLRLACITGERETRVDCIDELPRLLRGMFPDIVAEVDVWCNDVNYNTAEQEESMIWPGMV